METIKVNMTPCEDIKTIHASQNDNEAREWGFELHNNGEKIDSSSISDQMVFKSYEGGTEQILPENGAVPVTAPFVGDIKYPDATRNDQEFLYRESPTEEDGYAKITDIKGNTLNWNQLVQNGNFANGVTNWTKSNSADTITVSNNVLSFHTNIVYGSVLNYLPTDINNHLILAKAQVRITGNDGTVRVKVVNDFGYTNNAFAFQITEKNVWKDVLMYGVYQTTPSTSSNRPAIGFQDYRSVSSDNLIEVKNVQIFDLTLMGLDVTADDFMSLFNLPYYDYCQGAMLSFGGRNVKFNQLVQNGNFADSSNWVAEGSSTINSITNNTINVTTANAGNSGIAQISFPMTNGHKYLLVATIKTTGQTNISVSGIGGVLFNTNSFVTKCGVFTWTEATGNQWSVRIRNFDANSATFEAKNVMLIDLTEMFGSGNEPSAEGFLKIFTSDYYEYTTGQYMNIGQPVSLKTVGFNLFDQDSVLTSVGFVKQADGSFYIQNPSNAQNKVLFENKLKYSGQFFLTYKYKYANTTSQGCRFETHYTDGAVDQLYGAGSNDFVEISFISRANKVVDYICATYGSNIETWWKDVCINFSDTERNGTYEPYTESTLSIPLDEFPNGMDGINDVKDEKNETGYVKRIGQITFDGTQSYIEAYINNTQCRVLYSVPNITPITMAASVVDNWIMSNYLTQASNEQTWNGNAGIHRRVNGATQIMISLGTASGITTVEEWNAYLSAHPLTVYYPLNVPLENYGVVDLGTLNWTYSTTNMRFTASGSALGAKPSANTSVANVLCTKYATDTSSHTASSSYDKIIGISDTSNINIRDTSFNDATTFKQSLQGVYLLYEKQNPQGFTTATLVTENGEVALANENGVLVGKCNSDVSADAGFIEGKIKLSDEDGDVYSNKIQIHVERSPQ